MCNGRRGVSTGVGAAGTGTQRVVDVASGTIGAAPPTQARAMGGVGSGATGGFLIGVAVGDTFANINISTATTTLIVTGVSGRHVRITALSLVTAAANNVALISGTGATCGTGTTGMTGGTTAASGYNFAANGGVAQGTGIGANQPDECDRRLRLHHHERGHATERQTQLCHLLSACSSSSCSGSFLRRASRRGAKWR